MTDYLLEIYNIPSWDCWTQAPDDSGYLQQIYLHDMEKWVYVTYDDYLRLEAINEKARN